MENYIYKIEYRYGECEYEKIFIVQALDDCDFFRSIFKTHYTQEEVDELYLDSDLLSLDEEELSERMEEQLSEWHSFLSGRKISWRLLDYKHIRADHLDILKAYIN